MIVYSSSTCPKCKVLKMKLDKAGFEYEVNEDMATMEGKGIKSIPIIELSDGTLLDFPKALAFISNMEAAKNDN